MTGAAPDNNDERMRARAMTSQRGRSFQGKRADRSVGGGSALEGGGESLDAARAAATGAKLPSSGAAKRAEPVDPRAPRFDYASMMATDRVDTTRLAQVLSESESISKRFQASKRETKFT